MSGDYKVVKDTGVETIQGVTMKTTGFVVYGQNTCVTYNFSCEEVDRLGILFTHYFYLIPMRPNFVINYKEQSLTTIKVLKKILLFK